MTRAGPRRTVVVAAVVRRADGRFLLARRLPGSHLGGLWEFPGGTVERGEAAELALVRELEEELGVDAEVGTPITFAWHRESGREVLLLFYETRIVAGAPAGRQGQEVGWYAAGELARLPTPPADAALIERLVEEWGGGEETGDRGQGEGGP